MFYFHSFFAFSFSCEYDLSAYFVNRLGAIKRKNMLKWNICISVPLAVDCRVVEINCNISTSSSTHTYSLLFSFSPSAPYPVSQPQPKYSIFPKKIKDIAKRLFPLFVTFYQNALLQTHSDDSLCRQSTRRNTAVPFLNKYLFVIDFIAFFSIFLRQPARSET